MINLDGVIGRRGMTIQLPPSILAKFIIFNPISIAANTAAAVALSMIWTLDYNDCREKIKYQSFPISAQMPVQSVPAHLPEPFEGR
jgi:hypothetical protein